MTHHLPRRALLACIPALALVACSDDSKNTPPSSTPASATATGPTDLDGVKTQPAPTDGATEGGPVPATAAPSDETAAIAAAQATMDVWVQGSTLDEQTWRSQLNDTMTPIGQDNVANTWGYRVKAKAVTGAPVIVRANAGSAVLTVETDYTTYTLTVVVTEPGVWKTASLTTDGTAAS